MIVSMARSGSNLLRETINSLDDAICFGELFKKNFKISDTFANFVGRNKEEIDRIRTSNKAEYYDIFFNAPPAYSLIGGKIFYYHAEKSDAIWSRIAEQKVVHLIRWDRIAAYTSLMLAKNSGNWRTKVYNSNYDNGTIRIDAAEFVEWCRKRDRNIEWARRSLAGADYHEVVYEDICTDGGLEDTIKAIFGRELGARKPKIEKQRRRDLDTIVENFDEIQDLLKRIDG